MHQSLKGVQMSLSIETVHAEAFDLYEVYKMAKSSSDERDRKSIKALLDYVANRKDEVLSRKYVSGSDNAYRAAEAWYELELACGNVLLADEGETFDWNLTLDEMRYALPQVLAAKLVDEGMDVDDAFTLVAISPSESQNSIYVQAAEEMMKVLANWGIQPTPPTTGPTTNQFLRNQLFHLAA